MKTVQITETFTGYPNDKKRVFVEGEEPDLSDEYADLIVGKGHARLKPGPKPETKKDDAK